MRTTIVFGLLTVVTAYAGTQNQKAHVHGSVKLTIVLENDKSGTVALDGPAESFLGFEHRSRNAKEAAVIKDAFDKFKSHVDTVVRFDPKAGCTFSQAKIDFEAPEKGADKKEEGHADLNASYSIACQGSLTDTSVRTGLMEIFPRVKKVSLQVLTPNGQTEKSVTRSDESVRIGN